MVLQKRLDYGSSGYHVPAMPPHVPRSAKGKRSIRKKTEENPLCAFDLLATVAGKLLQERENSAETFITDGTSNSPSAKDCVLQEQLQKEQPCGAQVFDYLSSNKSTLGSQSVLNGQLKHPAKDHRSQIPNTASRHPSVLINTSDKEAFSGKLSIDDTDGNFGLPLGTMQEKCGSPVSTEFCKYKLEDGIKTPLRAERRATGSMIDGIAAGMCSVDDPMALDTKPPALVSSDSSVEVPLHGARVVARNTSFPNHGNGMKRNVNRDDDENSSGCTHPSTISKSYRTQCTGDRKIRKLLGSKYRKVASSMLHDGEFSDTEMKPVSHSRKMCYTRQRTQRGLFKRRKLFERCTVSASDEAVFSEDTSSSPVKGHIKVEPSESDATQRGANGASSSSTGQKSSYGSEDFQVKFSIKSFKVPELLIEIPENATVGSLKRTVMEAVTAILGGGFRVGVLLQGKKVRDDTGTLLQAGISHGGQLDNLGFTLEPKPTQASTPLTTPKEAQFDTSCKPAELLTRIPAAVIPSDQGASDAIVHPQLTPVVNFPESDHDSVHSPADLLTLDDKTAANSKALVPVPAISVEALAVVPLRKSRRSELVQRRIRRPFSVSEVEALVQAVEKLGTGRWRDVKLRAFDNAKHRTYVDLKDKWKTLVHTARISPQQRRGEPVPQELLDRVLAAHAYWSQQQAKLQVKPPPAESCLLT